MPAELSDRIAQILRSRHDQVLPVKAEIDRWRDIDNNLAGLSIALTELRSHPSVLPDDEASLVIPYLDGIRADIAAVIEAYGQVAARFARDTVNIGVSGSARVGKSTLLQSISGLTDQQIPTGRDIPVTAVRSRIFHSARPPVALLRLHSPHTFLSEVVGPYHAALSIPGVPGTLEEFRNWAYPDTLHEPDFKPGDVALLARVREMQEALWSYEKDLTGGDKSVHLQDLRPYVAYPTSAERAAGGHVEHRYLAVRDVRIDCEFPRTEVDQLGIVDLPGLGEVAVDAERHHVTGLRQDVDVVLLVKRAAEGMAFWSSSDAQAINLLDEARGAIRSRGDFVYIVINARAGDDGLADALRADIVRQVNDGEENRYFIVLAADVAQPASVREFALTPLLRALANRLPVMDGEFLDGAKERAEATAARVRSALQELLAVLAHMKTTSGNVREDLEGKAKQLREDLSKDLGDLVEVLRAQATSGEDDPEYAAAVDGAYGKAKDWIEGGFAVGEQAWCDQAGRTFRVERNAASYGGRELNRIRVEISQQFAGLNDYFSARVEETRRQVGVILRAHFGTLLAGIEATGEKSGTRLLERSASLLAEASEPCPTLRDAVSLLLELRLEYRTQFHPRVREQLDSLNMQYRDAATGKQAYAIAPELTMAGAQDLFRYCTQRARQAAWETRKALLAEKVTPLLVIYAAAEQFEDAFIRSGGSEREFRRLAYSYRDELWPGVYAGLNEGHARYAKVTRLIKTITEKLA